MMVTAYKLNGVVIFPKTRHQRDSSSDPEVSKEWYILPGRKLIHINKLANHAMKLNQPLEKVQVPLFMPLDMERITP
jgi:hypothetical protein